jgi:hypothetical protein
MYVYSLVRYPSQFPSNQVNQSGPPAGMRIWSEVWFVVCTLVLSQPLNGGRINIWLAERVLSTIYMINGSQSSWPFPFSKFEFQSSDFTQYLKGLSCLFLLNFHLHTLLSLYMFCQVHNYPDSAS